MMPVTAISQRERAADLRKGNRIMVHVDEPYMCLR